MGREDSMASIQNTELVVKYYTFHNHASLVRRIHVPLNPSGATTSHPVKYPYESVYDDKMMNDGNMNRFNFFSQGAYLYFILLFYRHNVVLLLW